MKNKKIKQLVVNAMFIALLVVSSFISIPIGQIPYTLQLLIVFIILLIMDTRDSLIIFGIYLIMGIIGLPIFSSFSSGITPTLGFIIGIAVSPLIYLISDKVIKMKKSIKKFLLCLICLLFINLIGSIYFMIYMRTTFVESLILSVLPYLLIDLLKIIIALLITKRLNFSSE